MWLWGRAGLDRLPSLPGWGLPGRCLLPPQIPVVQPSVMDDIEVWLRTDLVRLHVSVLMGSGEAQAGAPWDWPGGPRGCSLGSGGGRLGRRLQDAP